LTTNAGSDRSASIGFGKLQERGGRDTAIKELFRPEFRNRLDEVIHFNPLPKEVIASIVDKFVAELEAQLGERKISITLAPEAREWLGERGYDPLLGARPMSRVIQREVKDVLADEILFGKLQKGGEVRITLSDGKLLFEVVGRG
jgi:ATP-dependent Clp protease ATP-binding subunit ClpA